jgi:predicted outer membrane protein
LLREDAQADAQVDALVASSRQRISSSDEDASMKQRALEALQASADSFRRYRSKQCEFEASTAAGGNSAGDLRALCGIALDNAYIEHMKSVHGFGGP